MIKMQNICRKTKEKLKCKYRLDITANIRFDSQTTKHSNKFLFQINVQISYCAMLFAEEMHQDMHYGIALAAMKLTTLAHCSTTFVKWRRRFFGNFFSPAVALSSDFCVVLRQKVNVTIPAILFST